jgi:hypothetical protein
MDKRIRMKIRKIVYWIIGTIVFLGWTDLVWGQELPEIVPYRLVPSQDYSCFIEIEIVEPVNAQYTHQTHREEIFEILMERAAYEEINPMERSQMFSIDNKTYYLVRIPYNFENSSWTNRNTTYSDR